MFVDFWAKKVVYGVVFYIFLMLRNCSDRVVIWSRGKKILKKNLEKF
jgi:hypothetical protein